MEEHQRNISDALSKATKNTEKQALTRTEFYNRKAKQAPLRIGTRVFLKNRIPGRNKIQDCWLPTPYKVMGQPRENVFTISPADGSEGYKNVSHRELLDGRQLVDTSAEGTETPKELKELEVELEDTSIDIS